MPRQYSPKVTARILNRAKNNLTTYGWIKGSYGNKATGFCLVGAILEAQTHEKRESISPVYLVLNSVIQGTSTEALTLYNDAPSRSFVDVLAVLDAAIERLESESI